MKRLDLLKKFSKDLKKHNIKFSVRKNRYLIISYYSLKIDFYSPFTCFVYANNERYHIRAYKSTELMLFLALIGIDLFSVNFRNYTNFEKELLLNSFLVDKLPIYMTTTSFFTNPIRFNYL